VVYDMKLPFYFTVAVSTVHQSECCSEEQKAFNDWRKQLVQFITEAIRCVKCTGE
jgi:cytochrome c-type biogenesis protein CcmH/NrfF